MRRTSPLLALLLLAAACGPGSSASVDAPTADAPRIDANTGPDGAPVQDSLVYGHSNVELYRIDSNNLDVIDVGPFGTALGSQGITDIAVDKNGAMIGITRTKIFDIDPATGTATHKVDFPVNSGNFTSLSFVPVDANNPASAERLVAADDVGDVYEINPSTGATSVIGNYGLYQGTQIVSSGDIVSVRGFGTFATVDVTGNFRDPDYLAQIDPVTWAATPIGSVGTGVDRIFGLGFWGGTLFGFVDNGDQTGQLITIDPVTGTSTPATSQTFAWWGAGVTTTAPIVN